MLVTVSQISERLDVNRGTVKAWLRKYPSLTPVEVRGQKRYYESEAAAAWAQARIDEREEREHRALDNSIRAIVNRLIARRKREARRAAVESRKARPLGVFEIKQEALAALVGVKMSRVLGWWDAKLIIAAQSVYGLRTFDLEDLWAQVERGRIKLKPEAAARLEAEIERRRFGLGFSLLPRGESEMGVYSNELHQTDATRKSAIVALVEGAEGPLSLDQIRKSLGVNTSTAARLVNETVDAGTIAVVKSGDSQPSTWRYKPAA